MGGFASADITIVKAYHVFTISSSLSYAVLESPRRAQFAVLEDENGIPTLIHLADTEADASNWLKVRSHPKARIVPADTPEPRTFIYLRDPTTAGSSSVAHSDEVGADLVSARLSSADFIRCSYVLEDSFALEEDCDMPKFLKRLDERGIAYRLREQHTNGDAMSVIGPAIRARPLPVRRQPSAGQRGDGDYQPEQDKHSPAMTPKIGMRPYLSLAASSVFANKTVIAWRRCFWACPDLRSGRVLSRGEDAARPSRLRRLGPFG